MTALKIQQAVDSDEVAERADELVQAIEICDHFIEDTLFTLTLSFITKKVEVPTFRQALF